MSSHTFLELHRTMESQDKSKLTLEDEIRVTKVVTLKVIAIWIYMLAKINIDLFVLYKVFGLSS